MSVLPSEQVKQDRALEQERLRTREIAQAELDSWRAVWESAEWSKIRSLVEQQRAVSLNTLLGLSPSAENYGVMSASLSGHLRALDWLLGLPAQTVAKSSAQLGA